MTLNLPTASVKRGSELLTSFSHVKHLDSDCRIYRGKAHFRFFNLARLYLHNCCQLSFFMPCSHRSPSASCSYFSSLKVMLNWTIGQVGQEWELCSIARGRRASLYTLYSGKGLTVMPILIRNCHSVPAEWYGHIVGIW